MNYELWPMSCVMCQMSNVPCTMYYVPSPMFYGMFPLTCVLVLPSCSFSVFLSKASITLLISIIFHQRFRFSVVHALCFLFYIEFLVCSANLSSIWWTSHGSFFRIKGCFAKKDLPPKYMVVKNCSPPDQIFLTPLWGIYCIWLYQLTVKTV